MIPQYIFDNIPHLSTSITEPILITPNDNIYAAFNASIVDLCTSSAVCADIIYSKKYFIWSIYDILILIQWIALKSIVLSEDAQFRLELESQQNSFWNQQDKF